MIKSKRLSLDFRHEDPARPKHERLKAHLVDEMIAGRLAPGDALPSEHHLAETLGYARTTIRQTMASLESDGLVRRVQGKGTFVESDVGRKLRRDHDIFALVVPETRTGFYPSLLHGFDDAAGNFHHQTIICNTNNEVERQGNILLQLIDKKVGGVAIVPTSEPTTPAFQIRPLRECRIPVVFCHRRVEGIKAPLLAIPFHEIGRLAGKALAELGHRRVAFFANQRSLWVPQYEQGLRDALQAGGGDILVESVYAGESIQLHEEKVWTALQRLFAKPDRPTAIFASFDSVAEMIYLLLPRLGLRVPEDVSLVGAGGAFRDGAIARRLASVVIDEAATGQKAVSLLHEMRSGQRPIDNNEEFVLHLDLYRGETLAAPAQAKAI
jgi:GntR family transcriptional regulator, arabinose operon transcriptional repressor